jgi:hypothetical protein
MEVKKENVPGHHDIIGLYRRLGKEQGSTNEALHKERSI